MKNLGLLITATALFAFVSCKNEKKDAESVNDMDETVVVETKADENKTAPKSIMVAMESKSGSTATGEVVFTEEDGMVKMEAKFTGLTPGTHAIHLHEKADCSSDDGKSTGGHWNPTHEQHGKWGDAEGYHKGDIGNFEADADGNGSISMQTDEWCIDCDDENKNIVGKAVIVHDGEDDFVSQPTGDAGGRVACGGIIE
ncbi:superoxide dismutase family protein [Aequorivita marina]|uniref:superoxide dismutase family protein n=1 Tax=Aequorivita marina TaxID=3073654 RepID=UPI00287451C5|nr:superoxide dismutase family protein [Aequorivita sp. S2608]MDS1299800.1 superoxide dismutase family protein [Aequorivita sp. S2608]